MVDTFEGERVALTIFNSTSRTVFPLTNDYDLIKRELEEDLEAIDFDEFGYRLGNRDYSDDKVRQYVEKIVEGTKGIPDQASVVPDGLRLVRPGLQPGRGGPLPARSSSRPAIHPLVAFTGSRIAHPSCPSTRTSC